MNDKDSRLEKMLAVCCACPSIRRRDSYYLVGDDLIHSIEDYGYVLSHTYCPPCEEETRKEIRRYKNVRS